MIVDQEVVGSSPTSRPNNHRSSGAVSNDCSFRLCALKAGRWLFSTVLGALGHETVEKRLLRMKAFDLPSEVRVIDIQDVLRRRFASQNRFPRGLHFWRILVLLAPNAELSFLLVLDNIIRDVFGGEVVSRASTIKIAGAVSE